MHYIIDYNICALLITIITMLFFWVNPKLKDRQDQFYEVIGCFVLIESALNIVTVFTDGHVPEQVMIIIHMAYLFFVHTLPILMFAYTSELVGKHYHHFLRLLIGIPYAAGMLMLFTTTYTHWIFYVVDGTYYHGTGFTFLYIEASFYVILVFFIVGGASQFISRYKKCTILFFIGLQIVAICIQYIYPQYLVVDLAGALSLMSMYIALHSAGSITDSLTQAYNASALNSLIRTYYSRQKNFYLLGYKICGLNRISEVYGDAYRNGLLCYVADALKEELGGKVARIAEDEFGVLIEAKITEKEIKKHINQIPCLWGSDDYEVIYDAAKALLRSSDFLTPTEIIGMINFAFHKVKKMGKEELIVIDKQLKAQYFRWNQVHEAIVDALAKNGITVYFQPIVSMETGEIFAAEALCRLTDPVLGSISPAEFIPVAEQSGLISQIDNRVRNIVWDFLRSYDIRKAGIDHISVNLSVAECSQPFIVHTIEDEAELANVERGTLHFEITETVAITSPAILAEQMRQMQLEGFCFHLDDYGTGYSGVTNLISLPFSVVKLDKSILELAEHTEKGKIIKSMISSFHECQIKVVCEGIETPTQEEMMRLWGVDYLQGYLYSKPLPCDKFVQFAKIQRRTQHTHASIIA